MFGFTKTAGGSGYKDIRVGDSHNIHEGLLDVSTLGAADDAEGYLPPGLPIGATGAPVTAGDAYGIVGPEAVKMGTEDFFGNMIFDGLLNRDTIEDNLGRALTVAELAGIASGMPGLTLR